MGIKKGTPQTRILPRVLVVDDEPVLVELFRDIVSAEVPCQLFCAANLREAYDIIAEQPIELLVADLTLPDGDGLQLLPDLHRLQPGASVLVVTGSPSVDRAITALRGGAVDFLPKPFSAGELAEHVRSALAAQKARSRQDARIDRLRAAVKRLNEARRVVTRKVDLLCNDLISAYGQLSRQLDSVRIQESYRQSVVRTTDLEQLLCNTMDWLLRQVGYCNIGIWLASAEQELQLGAYMKYTIPAEAELTQALQRNLLRLTLRRGFVRLGDAESKSNLIAAELKHLAACDVAALNCTYLGESLAVIVLYRDEKTPFSSEDIAAVKGVGPLFALELARAVKGIALEEPELGDAKKPRKKKKDPADWWKDGEEPPF